MKRTLTIIAVVANLAMTAPTMAQEAHPRAGLHGSSHETVPLRVRDDQVAAMQQKLNEQGFNAGPVDGLWGPDTSAGLRRYQASKALTQSGQLDAGTLAALGIAPAAAPAQSATATPASPAANAVTGTGLVGRNTGVAGAAGNRNQAVATTAANAPQPAQGANSFSRGEAQRRIERQGYSAVSDLTKDGNGVWRGHATKGGASVGVWLDYKGDVGQQ